MIVADQVEKAMQCKDAQFCTERVAGPSGLSRGDATRDGDVTEERAVPRKRQDVGRPIFPSVKPVEGLDSGVRDDGNGHLAPRAPRSDPLEPSCDAGSA